MESNSDSLLDGDLEQIEQLENEMDQSSDLSNEDSDNYSQEAYPFLSG